MSQGRIFLLDNQDSFAYNLVDELALLGFELEVYRNQVAAEVILERMDQAAEKEPVMLCLSPGPGHPQESGCLLQLLKLCHGRYPILGICLGFQAMIHFLGGRVAACGTVMHGKTSAMTLTNHPVFEALQSPLQIARYHSLQAIDVPPQMTIIGDVDGIPMAGYDPSAACLGFQFHPESMMTTHGSQLLQSSVNYLLNQAETLSCAN